MLNCGVTIIVCAMISSVTANAVSSICSTGIRFGDLCVPVDYDEYTDYNYDEYIESGEILDNNPPTPPPGLPPVSVPIPPRPPEYTTPSTKTGQPDPLTLSGQSSTADGPSSPDSPEETSEYGVSEGSSGSTGSSGPSTGGYNPGQPGQSGTTDSSSAPSTPGLEEPGGPDSTPPNPCMPSPCGNFSWCHVLKGYAICTCEFEDCRGTMWHNHYELKESKCPMNKTCARKCCPVGKGSEVQHHLNDDDHDFRCHDLPEDKEFNPQVWDTYSVIEGFDVAKKFHLLKGKVKCKPPNEVLMLVTNVTKVFRLQSDGTLAVESHLARGPELKLNTNKYCIDRFFTADNTIEWNALICLVKSQYKIEWHFVLTGCSMLIICFLVLLRVIAFAWLPELRTLHGIILMAYLMSFLVGFLLLGIKLLLMYEQKINREFCVAISFVSYLSILSAFFWRNVMCYDIWWTFSGNRAMSGQNATSRARLYLYCAYAFGGPIALTILLVTLEYSGISEEYTLMPKVRIHGCNSLFGYSKLIYFYGPLMTLFVANIILFTLTALKIAAIKKETKMMFQSEDSCTHDQKNEIRKRFTLFVKLFTVMVYLEVNWILEIVTIFCPDVEIVLQIVDMYNVVMLLIVLVHFLCQKQTWKMIIKRYKQIKLSL